MDNPPERGDHRPRSAGAGRGPLDRAFPQVYDELRLLAHRQLDREAEGHTLGTTALVHEAYLRLAGSGGVEWHDRGHFFALAATAMRRILVDHARRRGADKRGGAPRPVPLEDAAALAIEERAGMLVALDEALERLAALDARQARVIECRFFGGLTEEETAQAVGVGLRTVKRDWAKARAWLYQELFLDASG
ncbi:MAG: Gll4071 protein [uncultured Gemmatimonadetes bacterium]|uniref:Gll4071 protein n=1 Tax=uncultured Gemmatimonadota bacterium TaxID=203437 RepID=A0A6J4KQR2_9BACT|nr:MAG: Gll4071 protein [uncultured Gemmatimonadota bacterium]